MSHDGRWVIFINLTEREIMTIVTVGTYPAMNAFAAHGMNDSGTAGLLRPKGRGTNCSSWILDSTHFHGLDLTIWKSL